MYDTVVFTCRNPQPAILAVLALLRNRWPQMQTEVEDRVTLLGGNLPQLQDFQNDKAGVWVCRDPQMRHHWENVGGVPMSDGDGPVALLYRLRTSLTLRLSGVTEIGMPMAPAPYDAWFCSPVVHELTIVTPNHPDYNPFSAWMIEIATRACLELD